MGYTMSLSKDCPDWVHDPRKDCWGPCFNYSTNIADAWKVVEEMTKAPTLYFYGCYLKFYGDEYVLMNDLDQPIISATTAPMAICLAALKAKGVNISESGE